MAPASSAGERCQQKQRVVGMKVLHLRSMLDAGGLRRSNISAYQMHSNIERWSATRAAQRNLQASRGANQSGTENHKASSIMSE